MRGLQATVQRCSMTPSLSWSSTCLTSSIDEWRRDWQKGWNRSSAGQQPREPQCLIFPCFRVWPSCILDSWLAQGLDAAATDFPVWAMETAAIQAPLDAKHLSGWALSASIYSHVKRFNLKRELNYRRGIDYWERDVCRRGIEGNSACSRDKISTIPLTCIAKKKDLLVLGYLNTEHMFQVSWCCHHSLKYATTVYNWVFAIRSIL